MYSMEFIRDQVAQSLQRAIDVPVKPEELVYPPQKEMGDLAFPCFRLAKERGKNPAELAKEIVSQMGIGDRYIARAEATGPYVNILLQPAVFIDRLVRDIEASRGRYGSGTAGAKRQVMVEYANLNSHKEFHVGHLRNILYGLSIVRVLDYAGWNVVPVSYINDMGTHVAKCLWQFVRTHNPSIKETSVFTVDLSMDLVYQMIASIPTEQHTGKYLGDLYAESTRLLEDHPEWKAEVSAVHAKLESHDSAWIHLWQETRRWSLRELYQYLQDFGVVLKRQYLESEFIKDSQAAVQKLIEEGIAKEDDGAIIVDLDHCADADIRAQKLGVCIIRKSDGNLLYAAKDIPLAEKKFEEYPDLAESLLIVDSRQAHYFRQLFAILKLMGYQPPLKHLGFEFVTLPEGIMSSRKGTVVTLQDFLKDAVDRAREEILNRHDDWNEGKVKHTAWRIAMGGIFFTLLRQDPEKIIIFDLKQALAFDGDTGPYVQYAATRLQSILQKSAQKPATIRKGDLSLLVHPEEKRLALVLARLPEVCARAAETHNPSLIAQWCLEAAAGVNAFYREVPVLTESDTAIRLARLRFVSAVRQGMEAALWCLAIPLPDAM